MQPSSSLHAAKARHLLVLVICATVQPGFWNSARAVENIRNVTWNCTPNLEEPLRTDVSVTFDAVLTLADVSTGSASFSIVAHSPGGLLKHVAHFNVGPMDPRPPEGTAARFQVDLTATCDETRVALRPGAEPGSLTYADPVVGDVVARFTSQHVGGAVEIANGFWFSIRGFGLQESPVQLLPGDKLACSAPATTNAGTIGVYFDPQGTVCHGTIQPGSSGSVYIIAKLDGATATGISGSEFRFTGSPGSWQTYAVPNPDILSLGDPFASGVATAFACERPETQTYVLYTVVVTATDAQQDVTFSLEGRDPPLNPITACPFLVGCDSPIFTKHCVETVPCFVNSSQPTDCDTSVNVTVKTWSGVKELFR